jgi:hypothetical protein
MARFVRARRALSRQKRRFPARAVAAIKKYVMTIGTASNYPTMSAPARGG